MCGRFGPERRNQFARRAPRGKRGGGADLGWPQVVFTKTRAIAEGKKCNDILDVWLFPYQGPVSLENATTREVAQVRWATPAEIAALWEQGLFVPTLDYFFTLPSLC